MTRRQKLPPYVVAIWSPNACRTYHYFRHRLIGHTRIKAVPGTAAFWTEYQACMERVRQATSTIGAGRDATGGVRAVVTAYLSSAAFASLGETTRAQRRPQLLKFAELLGNDPVEAISAAGLAHLFSTSPLTMQHSWRKMLRSLFAFAVDAKLANANPAAAWTLEAIPEATGSLTWEDEHIEAFRAHWLSGTRERMALELLVNTAARGGSDVVRMGRQNVRADCLHFRAAKNGATVVVPLMPGLRDEIALLPAGQMLFLVTNRDGLMGGGGKRGNSTWGRFFRNARRAAGIPDGYSAHGIRKYTAVQLTYAGCSDQEILAVLGDSDPEMLRVYTAAAREQIKAHNAFAKLAAHRESAQIIPMKRGVDG